MTLTREIDRAAARRVAEALAFSEAAWDAEAALVEPKPPRYSRLAHKGTALGSLAAVAGLALLATGTPEHGEAGAGSLEKPNGTPSARAAGPNGAPSLNTSIQRLPPIEAAAGSLNAAGGTRRAVQWREPEGGNGHWYLLIATPSPISWEHARSQALRLGGDLATFSSLAEIEQFISRHADAGPQTAWIGLYQDSSAPDHSEPRGGWRWVTGEPVRWTYWSTGEPNELTGRENYANMWLNQSGTPGSWNDYQFGGPTSYIVEWPAAGGRRHSARAGRLASSSRQDGTVPAARGVSSCADVDFLPDRHIDAADLLILLARWREPGLRAAHDLNHDGSVDATDLDLFRSLWGPCPR